MAAARKPDDHSRRAGEVRTPAVSPSVLRHVAETVASSAVAVLQGLHTGRTVLSGAAKSLDDVVSIGDVVVESMVTALLRTLRPADAIIGEEGTRLNGTSGVQWVVDPIDGTMQYLRAESGFVIGLAAVTEGTVTACAVADPMRGHVYSASLGEGAFLDGDNLQRARPPSDLAQCVVATGFAENVEERARQATIVGDLAAVWRHVRLFGAAGYELVQLATGRIDGYVESSLAPWDALPGTLLAREAGCTVEVVPEEGGGCTVIAAARELFEKLEHTVTARLGDRCE
jgi:myo-inositol-1(or 4)-monophosphatase